MKLTALATLLLSSTLVADVSSTAPEAPPTGLFSTPYMTVSSPAGGNWRMQSESDFEVRFSRGEAINSFVAAVALFRMGPANSPEEYEELIRRSSASDTDPQMPDRYELLEQSIKYSSERAYPCVRYRATSKDRGAKGANGPLLLELDGLYCRHPADESVGVSILYSHRGLTRHAHLKTDADEFIQNVVLHGSE
ncbi:hypothetical protein ACTJI2_00110 [Pseudoxanthomonas sp. 22568]|uniref:hypothetical protein n=1 Tax=Pseudoxanthomonas sp. 22568 TaxID=3453945 RepID=UPI00296F0784|nr:hypothetical protein LAG73_11235 [Pseudoxanthomonas japonensis]